MLWPGMLKHQVIKQPFSIVKFCVEQDLDLQSGLILTEPVKPSQEKNIAVLASQFESDQNTSKVPTTLL